MSDLNAVLGKMMAAKRSADVKLAERFRVPYPTAHIRIGDYLIGDLNDKKFTIFHEATGEGGVFNKEDFEAYVKSFYGLNF